MKGWNERLTKGWKRLGSKVHKCTSYKLIIALKKMWKEWFTGGWKRQFWKVEKFTQLLVDKGVDEGVKWKVFQRVIRGKTERFINVPATSWQKHWRRCQRKGSLESERGNVESLENLLTSSWQRHWWRGERKGLLKGVKRQDRKAQKCTN